MSAAILDHARDTRAAADWSRSIDYHYFTLIWPICSIIHQSSSNRILPYINSIFPRNFRCSGVHDQKNPGCQSRCFTTATDIARFSPPTQVERTKL